MQQTEQMRTVDETAEQLALRTTTIRRKILERKIRFCKIGRSVRIPQSEIDRLIREGMREPVGK